MIQFVLLSRKITEAREAFYKRYGINIMHIDSIEKV